MEQYQNKTIPKKITEEAKIALSYYPELKEVPITFKFTNKLRKSFMQAQPKISGIFSGKKKRGYVIFINRKVTIEGDEFSVKDVPRKALIGWLGHELGHVMDYRERSAFGLIFFGISYASSNKYIHKAERQADIYAIKHGLLDYILATKNFILEISSLPEAYKNRIKQHYLSPEEVLTLVENLAEEPISPDKLEKKIEKVEQ